MKKINPVFILPFFLFFFFQIGKTQITKDSLPVLYVQTRDNNIFYGKLLERNRGRIVIETESLGVLEIRLRKVRYMELYNESSLINGVYWPKYKFPHHNTFTPTGDIGPTYYQNTLIYGNTFNYRIRENFSLGVGIIPLLDFNFDGFNFWISPKIKIPLRSKKIKMSVGYLGLHNSGVIVSEQSSTSKAGVVYTAISNGNEFYQVSAGIGTGMGAGKFFKWPFYTTSVLLRIKNRSFFRLEMMGGGTFGSFTDISFRTMARKATWDFGYILPSNRDTFVRGNFGGPYISVLFTNKGYK